MKIFLLFVLPGRDGRPEHLLHKHKRVQTVVMNLKEKFGSILLRRANHLGRDGAADIDETSLPRYKNVNEKSASKFSPDAGSYLDELLVNYSCVRTEVTDDADNTSFVTYDSTMTTSEDSTTDDGSFFSAGSIFTLATTMKRETYSSQTSCGFLDVMSSTGEGLNAISDMLFQTLQAGYDKKTKLSNTVKVKMSETMEKKRQERNEKKKIEREMQIRNDVIHAREELVAVANMWREGK